MVNSILASFLVIPEPDARFLTAIFIGYFAAVLYLALVARQSSLVQNLYFASSGIWIMYYVFGGDIWHSLLDITSVYCILLLLGGTGAAVMLTWVVTMGHLLYGYVVQMLAEEVHTVSWQTAHCVLVLKLVGLAYNYYDGQKNYVKSLSKEQKNRSLANLPSLLEFTGYCFFFGSVLAGPQIPFVRHRALTEGLLYDRTQTPSSIPDGVKRLSIGIVLAALYSVFNRYLPLSFVTTEGFLDLPLWQRLLTVLVVGKLALWRYITVWTFVEGSCIITGVSFKEVNSEGKVDWSAVNNVHLWRVETTLTLQGVIGSFNVGTNQWVAFYVYKRLKWLGSKTLSQVISLAFLSFWHGVWPGYALCFSFEFFAVMAERQFQLVGKRLLGCSLNELCWHIRLPLLLVLFLMRYFLLLYPLMFFLLLTWSSCWKFMCSVLFAGHTALGIWFLLYSILLLCRKI